MHASGSVDMLRDYSANMPMKRLQRVVAVVTPPQSTFELGCVAEVFGIEHPGVQTRYSFDVCAEAPGALPTKAGIGCSSTTVSSS